MSEKLNPFTKLREKIDGVAAGYLRPAWLQSVVARVHKIVVNVEEHYEGALDAMERGPVEEVEYRLRNAGVRIIQLRMDGTTLVSGQDRFGGAFTSTRSNLFDALANALDLQQRDVSSMSPPPPWHETESAGGMDLSGQPAPEGQPVAVMPSKPEPA